MNKTINDQVRAIEYVDVNGILQTVSSRDELSAAAGCFGLLGIVTHITYEIKKTTYAVMKPRKVPTMLAIPPPDAAAVPEALQINITADQVQQALDEFEQRAQTSECAEWAWFPYQSHVHINTWSSVPEDDGAVDYPSPDQSFLHYLAGWLGGIITSTDFYADLPARWQSQILATTAMAVLPPTVTDPPDLTIKTAVPNAQHLRRDFQYMTVRAMEFDLPIPPLAQQNASDVAKPDWSVVRKVWWDIINSVYTTVDSPLRLTVEMRVMADSDIIMAPQRGNRYGTMAIEIGTIPGIVSDED